MKTSAVRKIEESIDSFSVPEIHFKWIQPHTPFHSNLFSSVAIQTLNRLGLPLEFYNTDLHFLPPERVMKLRQLLKIPKASTYAIGALINQMVSRLKPDEVFLNIGVWHGFTYLSGLIENTEKTCIAVDNFSVHQKVNSIGQPEYFGLKRMFYQGVDHWAKKSFLKRFQNLKSQNHHFVEMDYVEYFQNVHQKPIGFYLYDAQHRYKDQLLALKLAEPFMTPGCLILIDDSNAEDNHQATTDFILQSRHRYEVLLDEKTAGNRHPTFWNGLMLIQKQD